MRAGHVRNNTNADIINNVQQFFLNKLSLDCCRPLINFQSYENVDFNKCLPVFLLFLWRSGFTEVLITIL